MKPIVIISGSVAQRPGQGGHTWVFLQYLLGFKRLGWEVVLVDWLSAEMCRDAAGRVCVMRASENVRYFVEVMERFGLGDSYSLLEAGTGETVGMSRGEVLEKARGAAFLLNVMGFLRDEEILAAVGRRVFLDIDPGFGQMWRELGLSDVFAGHDAFVTIGMNVGRAGCGVPTCGLPWICSPQPVVMEWWPVSVAPAGGAFTSVASWRGLFGPVEYRGKSYGLRVHEFRKFMELPRRTGRRFEVAMAIDGSEGRDLAALKTGGWTLVDPRGAAGDPWAYQHFIRGSVGELTVAKNMYVETGSGWFSDRSICYLASGRAVVAQDTGLKGHFGGGEGLLLFSTLEEAAAAVEEVAGNAAKHGRAAREMAAEYFDSDKVLRRLAEQLTAAAVGSAAALS